MFLVKYCAVAKFICFFKKYFFRGFSINYCLLKGFLYEKFTFCQDREEG